MWIAAEPADAMGIKLGTEVGHLRGRYFCSGRSLAETAAAPRAGPSTGTSQVQGLPPSFAAASGVRLPQATVELWAVNVHHCANHAWTIMTACLANVRKEAGQ